MLDQIQFAFATSDLDHYWGHITFEAIQVIGANSLAHFAIGAIAFVIFRRVPLVLLSLFIAVLFKDFRIDFPAAENPHIALIDAYWDALCYLFGALFIFFVKEPEVSK
jgi:hypothetical protein